MEWGDQSPDGLPLPGNPPPPLDPEAPEQAARITPNTQSKR